MHVKNVLDARLRDCNDTTTDKLIYTEDICLPHKTAGKKCVESVGSGKAL